MKKELKELIKWQIEKTFEFGLFSGVAQIFAMFFVIPFTALLMIIIAIHLIKNGL